VRKQHILENIKVIDYNNRSSLSLFAVALKVSKIKNSGDGCSLDKSIKEQATNSNSESMSRKLNYSKSH